MDDWAVHLPPVEEAGEQQPFVEALHALCYRIRLNRRVL
jgi:hypothetical protein